MHLDFDAINLFSTYMKLCDVPRLENEDTDERALYGKKLGLVNGSAWIQLWSYYFGRKYLPGVKLVNVGNEAIQLNFMEAHSLHKQCPPQRNIELFAQYAKDLVELAGVDAILVTCSTMNRSLPYVQRAVAQYKVPVVQIDQPMMEAAVEGEGNILIVATHGPTVDSTRLLLEETAASLGKSSSFEYFGATVEEAFNLLGQGRIHEHNEVIAKAIRESTQKHQISKVVLAQLSMSVFKLTYPDPMAEFGVSVITSGEEGFKHIRKVLMSL